MKHDLLRSVQFSRGYQQEFRNRYCQLLFIEEIFHQVSAIHLTYFTMQVGGRCILVTISRCYDRLNTYYSFALYFPVGAVAVYDMPVAADEPYRVYCEVFYGDSIGK